MAQIKDDENKYIQLIKHTNKETPYAILILLFLKANDFENELFYLICIFFRFLGLLIICGNYYDNSTINSQNIPISNIFRILSSYGLIKKITMTNQVYNLISIIVFILFLIFLTLNLMAFIALKNKDIFNKISILKIQIFLQNLLFLLFPYIIEFLSFIYYIQIFGDKFIIKKSSKNYINIIIMILNTLLIITLNIQGYFHNISINNPFDDNNDKIKLNYGRTKIFIISLLQNIIIIECLELYLSNNNLTIYNITLSILVLLIFIFFYLDCHYKFNYNTKTNYFINILSIFCFFSLFSEMILHFLGHIVQSYTIVFFYSILKLIFSFFFYYVTNNLYEKKMICLLSEKLFKIYDSKNISDFRDYDCLFYFKELYKKIKENNDHKNINKIVNIILIHQSKCNNFVCKCKYIQIFPYGKKYSKDYVNNFLERINLLFETIFVDLDYQNNYRITLLLAEHYCNFKDSPILSYSMIQTTLSFYSKLLNMNQLFLLLTASIKYISKCNDKYKIIQEYPNIEEENFINKQQTLFKKIFINYKYLIKLKKILNKYASDYIQIIKFKEIFEDSIQFKNDDNDDIVKIKSYFLTTKNINKIMNILLEEFKLNKNLINYIKKLDPNKVCIDIVYKLYLFIDLFYCRNCPDEMISLMNSYNTEKNIYSLKFDPNILSTLELLYINKSMKVDSEHFSIFKFGDGVTIHYIDETLSKILGFSQKTLLKLSIENAMPKELSISHTLSIYRYLILNKNRYLNTDFFLFDKDMQMHPMYGDGVSITGLGKNLFCILRVIRTYKENVYYFYLGKNFECFSLSHNFNNYNISLNLLNKYKIHILELFDFKLEELKVLNKETNRFNKYKENMDAITDYFYVERLFREKSKYNYILNKFRLLKLMKKKETIYNENNTEINDVNDEEIKLNLIEKIDNTKYELNFLKDRKLRRKKKRKKRKIFLENLEKLMDKYNEDNDDTPNAKISFSSIIGNACKNLKEIREKEIDYGYFNFEFGLTILYNSYYYIFKIEENCKELPLINRKKNKFIYDAYNYKASILEKESKEKPYKKTLNKEIDKYLEDKKRINAKNLKKIKVNCFNMVIPLSLFLIFILLIIYIIILIFQRNIISSGNNGFLIYYYNYYQRDQLFSLYSVLLSSYFHYLQITNFSDVMEEDDYIDLIKRYSTEFQNSFHIFYNVYITNKEQDTNQNNYIFEELNAYKISNYYNQTSIIDNYIKQSEYLGYISRLISIEDKLENIIEDSKLLFLGNIFNNENSSKIPTKTYYAQTLYYLSKNYENLFNKVYTNLETESILDFNKLGNESRGTYLYLEILGFLIIFIFYITNLIFLFQANNSIFRKIISMFISKNNGYYNTKNKKENYFLIKIISGFIALVNDFNLYSLHKFQYTLTQSSIHNKSIDSTLDFKDDNSEISFEIAEENIKKNKRIKNNKRIINKIIDNKNNFSQYLKQDLSSSKGNLKNSTLSIEILKNLNSPQFLENNDSVFTKKSLKSNNSNTNDNLIKSPKNYKGKTSKNINKKLLLEGNQEKERKKNKIEDLNSKEKMTTEMFLKKFVNINLKEIKISLFLLNVLFFFVIVFITLKIIFSINFIRKIIEIFEDFGVLSYRYSSMYYYFNSLRTLLVFPDFGNETIFEKMNENMADRLKKMNVVLDFKLDKYPSVGNYYWITGTNMKKPRPSPSYINITCYDDQFCRKIINHTKYEVLSEGLKMAVTSMYQQIINIYNDFKKEKKNINKIKLSSYIKEKFINYQYEKIDINLNYVFICIEYRIHEAFMTDLTSLINKYKSIMEILNICAIIYIFFVEIIVMVFIVLNLKKIASKIEFITLRINKSFNLMLKRNINFVDKNEEYDFSFMNNDI